MADQAELAFVKAHLNSLSSLPIVFNNDFQQPPHDTLPRVPVLPIWLPPPPKRIEIDASTSSVISGTISITFKSLKPAHSYTLSVSPADTIADIKTQLAAEPGAPPTDVQRLLIKGKALADAKLLREYSVKDGDTVNLMLKPGYAWDPTKLSPPSTTTSSSSMLSPLPVDSDVQMSDSRTAASARRGHGRVPSVVLSPSPDVSRPSSPGKQPQELNLLDDDIAPSPTQERQLHSSTYHDTIAQPAFWDRLLAFLRSEFSTREDGSSAFEDFLLASKGTLTVSEIAKIRDHVGIIGMAGT